MKIVCTAVMALLLAGTVVAQRDAVSKSFSVNKDAAVEVDINYGDIHFAVGKAGEVTVRVEGVSSPDSRGLAIEQTGNVIQVEVGFMSDVGVVTVYATVPPDANLTAETAAGEVSISGDLLGNIRLKTMGGNITADDVMGNVDIVTLGGNIELKNTGGDTELKTNGGNLRLGDVQGRAKLLTHGGNIRVGDVQSQAEILSSGGNLFIGSVGGKLLAKTAGGDIKADKVQGSASLTTAGGTIYLTSAQGEVNARTAGGDIKIGNSQGSINANTAAGDIKATLHPKLGTSSRLNTSAGDIVLMLPADAKVTILAVVETSFGWEDDDDPIDEIQSDFQPKELYIDKNTNRVIGKYEINGGGAHIGLSTSWGEIEIRKE